MNGHDTGVVIRDIRIPFWRLVIFFVKASIATLPALIIVGIIYTLVGFAIAAVLHALGIDLTALLVKMLQ